MEHYDRGEEIDNNTDFVSDQLLKISISKDPSTKEYQTQQKESPKDIK